jgi:hypothetical protein
MDGEVQDKYLNGNRKNMGKRKEKT